MAFDLLSLNGQQQVSAIYVAYFGRAPDPTGLNFWVGERRDAIDEGKSDTQALIDIAESFKNVVDSAPGTEENTEGVAFSLFQFPNLATESTVASFVNQVFQNLFNRDAEGTADDTETGLGFWTQEILTRLNNGDPIGDVIVDIASGAQGDDATVLQNKIDVGVNYANAYLNTPGAQFTVDEDRGDAVNVLKDVDTTDESVTKATEQANQLVLDDSGQSFTLTNSNNQQTSGVDTPTGTAGNDQFNAFVNRSFDSSDQIAGAGGTDKLDARYTVDGTLVNPDDSIQGNSENVENVFVRATFDNEDDKMTFDTVNMNGVEQLWNNGSRNLGSDDNTAEETLTFANVETGYTVGLKDTGVATEVNYADTSADDDSVAFAFDGVEASEPGSNNQVDSSLTANGVETITVDASGDDSALNTLNADSVETLNVSGGADLGITNLNAGNLTTVAAGGRDGALTLGDNTTVLPDSVTTVTAGGGDDAIHLSAGNVASDDSFDAGEGTDTVRYDGGTNANADAVANFENLLVTDTGNTYDLSAFSNSSIESVTASSTGGNLTIDELDGQSVALTGDAPGTVTLNAASSGSTADVTLDNANGENADGVDVGTLATSNIDTITVTSNGGNELDEDQSNSVASVDVATVNVSADAATSVTTGTSTTTLDASGSTADLTLDASNANNGVSITGGEGDDTITHSGNDDTINAGAGDDTVNAGTGDDTINLGAGDDTVAFDFGNGELDGNDSVDGGAGTDRVSTTKLDDQTVNLKSTESGPLSALSNVEQFQFDITESTLTPDLQVDDATVSSFGGTFDAVVKDGDEANDATANINASQSVLNTSKINLSVDIKDDPTTPNTTSGTKINYTGGNAVEDITLTGNGDTITYGTTSYLAQADSIDGGLLTPASRWRSLMRTMNSTCAGEHSPSERTFRCTARSSSESSKDS